MREHYIASWGAPSFVQEFSSASLEVVVFKWDLSSRTGGTTVYATYGVSGRLDAHGNRAEVFVGLIPDMDPICLPLANLAATVVAGGNDVRHGSTWDMGGPLWSGTELNFLVTLHQHSALAALDSKVGRVEFFTAIPIFKYEADFKKSHGVDALTRHWKENRVSFWDPTRLPGAI
ncbi:suppressor of fused domain protein [Dactylosporangium cerinum]|uniref:Suppressor of fused domain protein n=1 Tax=Dactylosporangium cerinum TaxID=1434730 RepID=A0ABV9WBD6_9ACTN